MTREEAKEKAYKDGGHVGDGFDAGVNYVIDELKEWAELLLQKSKNSESDEIREIYVNQYDIVKTIIKLTQQ